LFLAFFEDFSGCFPVISGDESSLSHKQFAKIFVFV